MTAWSSPMRLHAGTLTVERIANGYLLGHGANGVRAKTYFPDKDTLAAAIDTALPPPDPAGPMQIYRAERKRARS